MLVISSGSKSHEDQSIQKALLHVPARARLVWIHGPKSMSPTWRVQTPNLVRTIPILFSFWDKNEVLTFLLTHSLHICLFNKSFRQRLAIRFRRISWWSTLLTLCLSRTAPQPLAVGIVTRWAWCTPWCLTSDAHFGDGLRAQLEEKYHSVAGDLHSTGVVCKILYVGNIAT